MIRESKSDVYRQGDHLVTAPTGTPFCPVNMLERYFATAGLNDYFKRVYFSRGYVLF